jgi:sporulation protein YlmC with PRC-barrel domain
MKKGTIITAATLLVLIFFAFAAPPTSPSLNYPSSAGIRINNNVTIKWTNSSDTDRDAVRYNIFYSNDSGITWQPIAYNYGFENRLNDSSGSKNLSFSGNENQTVYITIPKSANITKARLNLTGYLNLTGPYAQVYNAFTDEAESDGNRDGSASFLSFGRSGAYNPVDFYALVYTPASANISMMELRLGPIGADPQTKSIIYDFYIAETNDYFTGDVTDNNITAYTKVKDQLNVSKEWGADNNVYKNITFDTTYEMLSSKKYMIWFKFVYGIGGNNANYDVMFDNDVTNNYSASNRSIYRESYNYLLEIRLFSGITQNVSGVWLEVGNEDGNYEFNQTEKFLTENETEDFSAVLQNYISNVCTANPWENCTIPLTVHSNTSGEIEISDIDIEFTDYWWNTSSIKEATTYRINITPTDTTSNGSSSISANDFTISHNAPNLTLNYPATSYSDSSSDPVSVIFNCSAEDDYGLKNISLYITDKSNNSFSLNRTTDVSGVSNTVNWSLNLNNGDYTWACRAFDLAGNYNYSENRSIKINYVAPVSEAGTGKAPAGGWTGSLTIQKIQFDVIILNFSSPINPGEFFNFSYLVKSTGSIIGDVDIDFWIEGEKEISSGKEVIYFATNEEKTRTTKLFIPSTTAAGVYGFYVKAKYNEQGATAKTTIEIKEETKKEEKIKISVSLNKILEFLKKNCVYLAIGFGILVLLFCIILGKKIKKRSLLEENRLKNKKGMKVISEDGIEIGKIKDLNIKDNKLHEWVIIPNRRIRKIIRKKKILLKHNSVKSIKELFVINERASKKLLEK